MLLYRVTQTSFVTFWSLNATTTDLYEPWYIFSVKDPESICWDMFYRSFTSVSNHLSGQGFHFLVRTALVRKFQEGDEFGP